MRRGSNSILVWLLCEISAGWGFLGHAADPGLIRRHFEKAKTHWAYQPIRHPAPPQVHFTDQVASGVDAFILEKLEAKGLSLSPAADRRTLLRRVYYDLVGIPPTAAELDQFEEDRSPNSLSEVVDRLLASPAYGERWGRHWLDVARYAETKDQVLLYGNDRIYPYAYTYRDYVIRAFNADTPFDQMVREQLAADRLPVEPWRLAALGFLTLGRLYDNNRHDQIDDQIDTLSRGFLGLTVACARCHDHKFDAIPTEDYYSLYGVFSATTRPYDLPRIEKPDQVLGGMEFEARYRETRSQLESHLDSQYDLLLHETRIRTGEYLIQAGTKPPGLSETTIFGLSLSPEDLRPSIINRWRQFLVQRRTLQDPVFGLWAELMNTPNTELQGRVEKLLASLASSSGVERHFNSLIVHALTSVSVTNQALIAKAYGTAFRDVYEGWRRGPEEIDASISTRERDDLLNILLDPTGPASFARDETPVHMSRLESDRFGSLFQALDKLAVNNKEAPPARAMVVRDIPAPPVPRVFKRGSPAQPGAEVPRGFLQVLSKGDSRVFKNGSGRLELAESIVCPTNPLTARVYVNRVWMHHFGEPLVSTPSDFGTRSDLPSHPELLDYLASTFMAEGWSIKKLHRRLVLSRVYQQASDTGEIGSIGNQLDPENRLLWHFHRRRLDFEAMRDTLLAVANTIDLARGGRSVDIQKNSNHGRRTVYALVDRQDLPVLFRSFDFACPDQSVERRPKTTVPQQALFALNSPFILDQAKALAKRSDVGIEATDQDVVRRLYRMILARTPGAAELDRATHFLSEAKSEIVSANPPSLSPQEQLAQVLLMSNELHFID